MSTFSETPWPQRMRGAARFRGANGLSGWPAFHQFARAAHSLLLSRNLCSDSRLRSSTVFINAPTMLDQENDETQEASLTDAWCDFASPTAIETYKMTENDARRLSLRLDMHFSVVQRLVSGELEAWGYWVSGGQPPKFLRIDGGIFKDRRGELRENRIVVGTGEFDRVVVRLSRRTNKEAAPTAIIPTDEKMKRGAKNKYPFTELVLEKWHKENPAAMTSPAGQLYDEYRRRFTEMHGRQTVAPVSQRQFHEYLKRFRQERNNEVI